ncbi:protein TBATA-like [Sinocyclocheilus rhinocerous]|uniref:protein TBATA-like n=1 Tax=Sinocyclocheilus rhinocerous TaxID=307959 RepID=UPI0007B7BFB2|nr:PREDICTED: protein TBATA-like [Sinocyclocheilus rhinocerous]
MEPSEEQVNEALLRTDLRTSPESVRQEKALCETPGTSRTSTRGSLRFGSLSHHSFFSRHNPHPHRVRHMQGLNGKPVCTVNDDWYGFTPLCPHPLIKSQVSVGGSRWSVFLTPEIGSDRSGPRAELISECWREELKDLATKVSLSAAAETQQDKREKLTDEEVPRRKTQYSAQSGRIIPASSWGGKKRSSRTSHKRAQRWQTQSLEGVELKVLELLCLSQWFSSGFCWQVIKKELVQGLLQQAMADSSSLTQQTSGPELLPLTSEDLPDHVFLSSSVSRRKSR